MRPLDWLTAGLAVLAIAGWLTEQVAAIWRDRRAQVPGANGPERSESAACQAVAQAVSLARSHRADTGRRIAAGGQQTISPRSCCSPGARPAKTNRRLTRIKPGQACGDRMPEEPSVPAPAESWPQPSLN